MAIAAAAAGFSSSFPASAMLVVVARAIAIASVASTACRSRGGVDGSTECQYLGEIELGRFGTSDRSAAVRVRTECKEREIVGVSAKNRTQVDRRCSYKGYCEREKDRPQLAVSGDTIIPKMI